MTAAMQIWRDSRLERPVLLAKELQVEDDKFINKAVGKATSGPQFWIA
jgi:hypothetical protein